MEHFLQRLRSKTYWAAVIGATLTLLETQVGLIGSLVPMAYQPYLSMVWPVVMIALREATSSPLSTK